MQLDDVTQEQVDEFFNSDPALCYLGLQDEDLCYLYQHKSYCMSPNAIFKGIYEHDTCDTRKLVAIARFEKFSDLACNFHLYVHTWLQKQGVATRAKDLAYNYVRDTTNMTKVIVMPPAVCEHVIAAAISWGCEHEATLKNCMTWRNKPVDLHIYSLEIKR